MTATEAHFRIQLRMPNMHSNNSSHEATPSLIHLLEIYESSTTTANYTSAETKPVHRVPLSALPDELDSLSTNAATVRIVEGIHAVHVTELQPATFYRYQVLLATAVVANKNDSSSPSDAIQNTTASHNQFMTGQFQTPALEGTRWNFTVAVAGCAMTGSRHSVFDAIATRTTPQELSSSPPPIALFVHLGDFHYADIGTDNLRARLDAVATALASPSQSRLWQSTALAYMWDDHDWLGNNAGGWDESQAGARETALQSYTIAFPHHPLTAAQNQNTSTTGATFTASAAADNVTSSTLKDVPELAAYHAFTMGTVRFVLTDLRSESTDTVMYSDDQREWFFNELSLASNFDFIVWISTKTWIGPDSPNVDDSWYGIPSERALVSEFISQSIGANGQGPQNLLMVAADAHMLAFDDGTNTYYGQNETTSLSFPILQSGPLDRLGSVKGGPFTDGCTAVEWERNHHYSTITFEFPSESKNQNGSSTGNHDPCLVITSYNARRGSVQARKDIVFTKRLCGQMFRPSRKDIRVGTCTAQLVTSRSRRLFWIAVGVTGLISLATWFVFSLKQAALINFLIWWAFTLTVSVGISVRFFFGNKQIDMLSTMIIILLQSLAMICAVALWVSNRGRYIASNTPSETYT